MSISPLNALSQMMTPNENLAASLLGGSSSSTSTSTDPMAAILTGEEQLMSLSSVGLAASKANTVAAASGDPNVIAGLAQVIQNLFTQPISLNSLTQMQTINKLAGTDPNTFNAVFKTADTLTKQGFGSSVQPFLAAVNAAYAQSGATAVSSLNTAVTNTLSSATSDTAATLQSLTTLFQQYTGTNTSSSTTGSTNANETVVLSQQPGFLVYPGSTNG